ncbi:MAG TPA: quinone-dependent dihydroorotate dehydrogenase [Polyangiaceae bacterium]|nr:quinone-dependent dihydroorotate dehydrogenase [Polyangiaceae bacterium]
MYRLFFLCVLRWLPTEWVHHVALASLRVFMALFGGAARWLLGATDLRLAVDALGLRFAQPVGLAAGFDKNATAYEALAALGFGFVEVGTVTGQAQPGNPKPRLFRLPADRALINRMGFNNLGASVVATHLTQKRSVPIGVNIGKTKVVSEENAASDYVHSARLLGPLADYMVVNVSSPNTPGLRNLQTVELLRPLLAAVKAELANTSPRRPLLVKIAPDLNDADIDAIAELALELSLDGIIATNTTISRAGLRSSAADVEACGAGGLSGAVLKARSLQVLERLYAKVGKRLTLISVGGIETAEDAWARLCAGASLVQIYTGFVYGGPLVVWSLQRGLLRLLRASKFSAIAEVVGSAAVAPPVE